MTFRLFKSEKMLSFDIVSAKAEPLEVCFANFLTAEYSAVVIPVITARSKYGFVLKVELNKLRIKSTSSLQNPFTYASCIGVSYSSKRIITFFL